MSLIITKLRPFVIICQINGLVPFSMEMDPLTRRFVRFSFSYKKLVSWWYAFGTIFQVMVVGIGLVWSSIGVKTGEESGLSTTVVALTVVRNALYMIQILYAKVILLRYKRLRKAIALIQEAEQYLVEEVPQHLYKGNSVLLRTIIGIILTFFLVLLHF